MSMSLSSGAFERNERIPIQFTGEGRDVSPPLAWSGIPSKAKELALIMEDPDAPIPEPWVHWVIYRIAPSLSGLPEGVAKTATFAAPVSMLQGKNSWGAIGYRGPAPPKGHGVHRYSLRLYALDAPLKLPSGATKSELLKAMQGHILSQTELIGTYER